MAGQTEPCGLIRVIMMKMDYDDDEKYSGFKQSSFQISLKSIEPRAVKMLQSYLLSLL